jgi:methenyltetrahydromethanopterin cyclohydrolase
VPKFEENLEAKPNYILVVANSARMLAQSAQAEGYAPLVIDCFGDCDTRGYCEDIQQIASLNINHIQPALTYFLDRYPLAGAVYGSGFEEYPEALAYLCERIRIDGNNAQIFIRLQNKREFFSILTKKNILYPEISFTKPKINQEWLIKPMQSQGGVGIRRYRGNESIESGYYWQRYLNGAVHSIIFLANGKDCQAIGYNRQWQIALNNRDEFIFAGLINHACLTSCQKDLVTDWVAALVPEYELIGLNSLDFIMSEDGIYLMEVNPRPTAAMQLYGSGLLALHITACQGKLTHQPKQTSGYCAYEVIYAKEEIKVPDEMAWPDYAMDLPRGGSIINPGQPICSMIMRGKGPEAILSGLKKQEQALRHLLTG